MASLSGNNISIADMIDFVNSYSEDAIQIDGKDRSARNSAGRRIARTEEGLRAFYDWFGDSKVVDENSFLSKSDMLYSTTPTPCWSICYSFLSKSDIIIKNFLRNFFVVRQRLR